jgi:hypothetical protein
MRIKWRVRVPRLPGVPMARVRLPYLGWRFPLPRAEGKGGVALAVSLLVTGISVTLAILFAIQGSGIRPPEWPAPAAYSAADTAALGQDAIYQGRPLEGAETQTLQLNVAGARLLDLTLEGLQLGKSAGLTHALLVTGDQDATGDLLAHLICESVIIDGLRASSLTLAQGESYELIMATSTADGKSVSPTLSSDPDDIVYGGSRGALKVAAVTDATYDRVIIDVGSSDALCRTLKLTGVSAYGAGVFLGAIKTWKVGSISDSTVEEGVSVQ